MVRYVDKTGESIEDAVIILDAVNHFEGIKAEYDYLEKKFGKRGVNWELEKQTLVSSDDAGSVREHANLKNGKMSFNNLSEESKHKYDKMDLILAGGEKSTVYFDISYFFGKI